MTHHAIKATLLRVAFLLNLSRISYGLPEQRNELLKILPTIFYSHTNQQVTGSTSSINPIGLPHTVLLVILSNEQQGGLF